MINDSKTYELIGEIAKLLRKYGKETFSELATILKDPILLNNIKESLENIDKLAPQKKKIQKRPTSLEEGMQLRESLVVLGKTEPEKSNILLMMFDSLQNKSILPSLRELTNFISDQGLPVPNAKSRDKVIFSFLKKCTKLSLNDLEAFNATINRQQHSKDTDRSLEGWGKVILDRKNR